MARRTPPPSRIERLQVLLDSRLGHVLVRLTVAALVFLIAGIVMRQARAYTYRMPAYRVSAEKITLVDLPAWTGEPITRALQPRMFGRISVSIYDPDAEQSVKAHIERHPLIRSVEQVRVLYPNRAEVKAVLRVPVAQVAVWIDGDRRGQVRRWRLLSDDGCLLPRSPYRAYLDTLPYTLPIVTGITERAPLDPGEVWEDRTERVKEAVAAANLSARLHRDLRGRVSVARIDVSRFPASADERHLGEVRLVLSCPPEQPGAKRVMRTVKWGRTDRTREAGKLSNEDTYYTKVKRLHMLLDDQPPPACMDVRYKLRQSERTGP